MRPLKAVHKSVVVSLPLIESLPFTLLAQSRQHSSSQLCLRAADAHMFYGGRRLSHLYSARGSAAERRSLFRRTPLREEYEGHDSKTKESVFAGENNCLLRARRSMGRPLVIQQVLVGLFPRTLLAFRPPLLIPSCVPPLNVTEFAHSV